VHGFRIPIPYLVKDLTEMTHEPIPLILPDNNTMPGSINMDFNREEDLDIIGSVRKDHAYWWNRRVPKLVADQEDDLEFPEVTRQVIKKHFKEFYQGVSHCSYKRILSTNHIAKGGNSSVWRFSANRTEDSGQIFYSWPR